MPDWMLYGATGYTGQLIAEEAVKRGHKLLLAGRSESKLKHLAERLDLEYMAVSLDEGEALAKAVGQVKLVYHAAGPFVQTSDPMLRACLSAGAHYLDIAGEIAVYQNAFRYHGAARDRGITIMPGVGFDVLPSDCLLNYVADQLPDATHLEVVLDTPSTAGSHNISAGTAKSALEIIAAGGKVRRDGHLVALRFGVGARKFRFPAGERWAIPVPWGDLEIGYRTTGIPNITAYLTFPRPLTRAAQVLGGLISPILQPRLVRHGLGRLIDRFMIGPSEPTRESARSYLYAQVRNARGETRQAWLDTLEPYQFTIVAAPLVVERILDSPIKGANTPALALGADFVLEIPSTHRDSLSG